MFLMPRRQKIAVIFGALAGFFLCIPNLLPENARLPLPAFYLQSRIVPGLDLQGGAHLVYEADVSAYRTDRLRAIRRELPRVLRPRESVGQQTPRLIAYRDVKEADGVLSLRLPAAADGDDAVRRLRAAFAEGGLRISVKGEVLKIDFDPDAEGARIREVTDRALEVMRRRVDAFGTREAAVMRQGDDRIVVQVPGVSDVAKLKAEIGRTAGLSFHEVMIDAGDTAGVKLLPDAETGRSIAVHETPLLTGKNLVDASSTPDSSGRPSVAFRLDGEGARIFADVTKKNIGRPFAIVLDGKILSAPIIQGAITGGSGIISGNFTPESAADLALLLRAGALPVPLHTVEERTVGPELGAESVRDGRNALLGAAVMISLFMMMYYGRTGVYASIALLINTAAIFGLLSLLRATLTLPGIAGIVLGMGLAVDANVLINERIREELRRGLTPFKAAETGYARAWVTVFDSHVTGLVSALLMFVLGAGPIKGFAVTLSLGIVVSLFTAVWVTRLLLTEYLLRVKPTQLHLGLWAGQGRGASE